MKIQPRKISIIFLAFATVGLSACSVAREDVRGTYDCSKIALGAPKSVFDEQFGKAMESGGANGESISVKYETSRLTEREVDEMASGKITADIVTLGLAEVINPFGLRDDSRIKTIHVVFSPDNLATSIEVTCPNHGTPSTYWFVPDQKCKSLCRDGFGP